MTQVSFLVKFFWWWLFSKYVCLSPTFNMLDLKKGKDTDYIFSWKSKDLFKSKLLPLHRSFSSDIKIETKIALL